MKLIESSMDNDLCNSSLQLYRRDVERLSRLSDNTIQALLQQVIDARAGRISASAGQEARNTLAEGLLHLVLPVSLRYSTLPGIDILDLIQESNMNLLNAIEVCPLSVLQEQQSFISYVCKCIRNSISLVLEASLPIRVPRSSLWKAKKRGTADELRSFQTVLSLDQPMTSQDSTLADLLAAVDDSVADSEQLWQSLALHLLSQLPHLEQRALKLRCGLDEEDQRRHTYAEIAQTLDIPVSTAYDAIRRGTQMLRGERELPQERTARKEQTQHWRNEREQARLQRLDAAFAQLQKQRHRVTIDRLAELAHVRTAHATAYLRQLRTRKQVANA